MTELKLKRTTWNFDPSQPIGKPGGFGAVYRGQSKAGEPVAIKRLHLGAVESAHRELRVADLIGAKAASHVIPVLDSGEDVNTGSYFIVMPVATESLQDRIDKQGVFSQGDARQILLEISHGLEELAQLVHRDLKPGNVLLHDEKWKIADFGIAKFVEESTSLQTLKDCLTAPYAAPEQWMFLHSTKATDLYALGCIGFQLLSGSTPFAGPTMNDFREQHIMQQPPAINADVDPLMRTVVSMLLRKAPESRPDLKRARELLAAIKQQESRTAHPLAQAAARLEIANAKAESEAAMAKAKVDARQRLANSGRDVLLNLVNELTNTAISQAPTARVDGLGRLRLGVAHLSMPMPHEMKYAGAIPEGSLPHSHIDMVALAQLILQQESPDYTWSCSLMYGKFPNTSEYRWYEVGFRKTMDYDDNVPFSLFNARGDTYPYRNFDLALAPIMHTYSTAFGPVPIDDEYGTEFVERWTHLFALAAEGKLKHPQGLPLMGKFWEAPYF